MSKETIKSTFECAKKNERHDKVSETRYWCDQYRMLTEWAIKLLYKQDQSIDWKDMYEKEKRRSAMWIAKYEKDIGPLERATPQQEQGEPVAWRVRWPKMGGGHVWIMNEKPLMQEEGFVNEPLYTTPQQRTWVGLTDEDKKQIAKEANYNWEMTTGEYAECIGRLTESKLREKNT